MSRVRVKICGVRTYDEAEVALDYGADALGFNFWEKSPRFVAPTTAREIIRRLPPFITCVGLFVNENAERLNEILASAGITVVQLHGDEKAEYVERVKAEKIIKAFRVGEDFDVNILKIFPAHVFLLDAGVKGQYGGTGQSFDWRIAVEAKQFAPIILAGGLNSNNIAEAISFVRPYAVDVCSGVESEPGVKDLDKLKEFLSAVEGIRGCNL